MRSYITSMSWSCIRVHVHHKGKQSEKSQAIVYSCYSDRLESDSRVAVCKRRLGRSDTLLDGRVSRSIIARRHQQHRSADSLRTLYFKLIPSGATITSSAPVCRDCRQDREVGCINDAHDTMVWSLAWHPMGHILVSGSNDHSRY